MNVINIENLWKEYRLGLIGYGTLTNDLQSWWARIRGKEDPNSKIPISSGHEKQSEGDRFWALRGVDLEIKQGDVFGIVGKNGAGKSTLLKILSRVTAPTAGRIQVKGRIASLLEVGTGFHPELTGRENIFLNGAILGMSKHEIRQKLDEIIDFSGVQQYLGTPVKRYSSGMRVRLAFAVAAHLEPEILVIDEVLAVGDMAFQRKCLGKMQSISEEGRTILFVSHNMASIKRLCSKAALIEAGKLKAISTPESIVNTYLAGIQVLRGHVSLPVSEKGIANLHEVGIELEGLGCTSNVPVDKPFKIKIHYSIREKLYKSQVAVAFVSNSSLETVFVTTSADLDRDSDGCSYPGNYMSLFEIPANFLNIGQYHLNLRIWGALKFDNRKSHAAAMSAISFQVLETGSTASKFGDNRKGYVTPLIRWDVTSLI